MRSTTTKLAQIFNKCSFYEKLLIGSFTFIFLVLSFDCVFNNLPLTGYGIIFLTFLVATCTSFSVCHAFNWVFRFKPAANQPFKWLENKIQLEEQKFLDVAFGIEVSSFQQRISVNEQMRLLLRDIETDYVKTWYGTISTDHHFLLDCHQLLEEIIFKFFEKLKNCNWKFIAKHTLYLYLHHLQEYKRSIRRRNKSCNEKKDIEQIFRYAHPASASDLTFNHYLSKIMETLIREYAPHDLVTSLESSIVTKVLARKMLKTLIVNVEDPAWIYIRFLYLVDNKTYLSLMEGKSYSVKEFTEPDPAIDNKFRIKPAILTRKTDLSNNIFNRTLDSKAFMVAKKDKNVLELPLSKPEANISSVLGNIISSTAAPLLPDNASLCYQPLNKMWLSPVTELKQEFTDSVVNPFLKTLTDGFDVKSNGLKEKFLVSRSKVLTRSRSSDAMVEEGLKNRDISIGEELCEGVIAGDEMRSRLVKTQSFDAGTSVDLDADIAMGDEVKKEGDAESGVGGDVSPVYEEPEDFETTIAKLRSVLQQRESSSTLSDKSNQSVESQDMKDVCFESGSKNGSVEEAIESQMVADIPSNGRPFLNISIPTTEIKESSSTAYVLYTIQYDGIYYIKHNEEGEPQLVSQTTIVKRRFQEFLNLQTRLEENSLLRGHLKGIKGPSKWISLPFGGKTDDSTTANRRPILEKYLQQLSERIEIAQSPAMHEFLAYGSNAATLFSSTDSNTSLQKIDKFLSNKVTGVFNSIKTVLPSFEQTSEAKEVKETKPLGEQNILQGFLGFGSKSDEPPPIKFQFLINEATGEALTDNIRHFLSEKSDCIEDALDVLDSSDWHYEAGECHVLSSNGSCVWLKVKEAILDDDLDKFNAEAPILNVMLEILCELLDKADGWVTKEPLIRIIQVFTARWEKEFETRLAALDWDRICGNIVRLLRAAIFSHQSYEAVTLDVLQVSTAVFHAIFNAIPVPVVKLIGEENLRDGLQLLVNSLSHSSCNRDSILQLLDLLLSQLLSCPHLQDKFLGKQSTQLLFNQAQRVATWMKPIYQIITFFGRFADPPEDPIFNVCDILWYRAA